MIRVLSPGLLTTVQDLGRPGYAHLGVSASGAADALSLRAGNRILGNPDSAAALEMTLLGGAFEFLSSAVVVLFGASAEHAPCGTPLRMRAGEVLRCGALHNGARCYLCVRGGVDVPRVLGSASTHLTSCLGGWNGRGLREGDVLPIGPATGHLRATRRIPPPPARVAGVVRVTPGAQAGWFGDEFYRSVWRISEHSDRMGLRLQGGSIAPRQNRDLLTEGVPPGAVQVPPDGRPIILFVEHGTTGGYPKIATAVTADRSALGQLRPRDEVGFERVSMELAITLLRQQEAWLDALGK